MSFWIKPKSFLLKTILLGAAVGIIFYLLQFILVLASQLGFSVYGVRNRAIEEVVTGMFMGKIIFYQVRIALAYATLGIFWGTLSGLFWYFTFNRRLKTVPQILLNLVTLAAVALYFLVRSILNYPQLYCEAFFNRGGFLRDFQVWVTDSLSASLLNSLGWAGLLIFLVVVFWFMLRKILPHLSWVQVYKPLRIGLPLLLGLVVALVLIPRKKNISHNPHLNILILSADSYRPDHIFGNGYFRKTTPHIDELLKESVNFNNAFTQLPRTFPAWVSFLTSLYPAQHGIKHMFPTIEDRDREWVTLPTILKEKGYRSAVVSDFVGDIFTRIDLGFDYVDAPYFNFVTLIEQRCLEIHTFLLPYLNNGLGRGVFPVLNGFAYLTDPARLGRKTCRSIRKLKDKPFFITVFFSTTHFPYPAPYPYYKEFTDPDYDGTYKYYKRILLDPKERVSPEDIAQIRAIFDGATLAVDHEMGHIIQTLKEEGLYRNTIIVVLSDHGENLYEKDWGMGHGDHFQGDVSTRIPLIIYNPYERYPVPQIDDVVRSIDLTPTLLDMMDITIPGGMEGVSLLPLMRGEVESLHLTSFSETGIWYTPEGDEFFQHHRIWYPDITELGEIDFDSNYEIVLKNQYRDLVEMAKHRVVRNNDYKLIYMPTRAGVEYELYDVKKDPMEDHNLADKLPGVRDRLKGELFDWFTHTGEGIIKNDFVIPIRGGIEVDLEIN